MGQARGGGKGERVSGGREVASRRRMGRDEERNYQRKGEGLKQRKGKNKH